MAINNCFQKFTTDYLGVVKISRLYFFLPVLMLLLNLQKVNSQTENNDSLISLLPGMPDDTGKVELLQKIAYNYSYNDSKKEFYFQSLGLKLSRKIGYKDGIAYGCVGLATYYLNRRELKSIDTFLTEALKIYTELNNYIGMGSVHSSWGHYYIMTNQYEKAISNNQLAYELYEKAHFDWGMGIATGEIGMDFLKLERYDEAEKYCLKSLSIREKLKDVRGICITLGDLGIIKIKQKQNDMAYKYLNKCISYEDKGADYLSICDCRINMAGLYREYKLYKEAAKMYDKCYSIYEEIGDTVKLGYVWLYRAGNLRMSGRVNDALACMDNAMAIVPRYNLEKAQMALFYEEYYYCYKALGDYRKALEYYEKTVESESDVFSTETNNKISELKEKYETDKKEQENQKLRDQQEIKDLRLQRQWYLIYGMSGIFLLIVLAAVLLIRNNRIMSEQKNMKLEQKLLRSQMNPHFIFNSLTAIQSYIFKNDPKSSGKFLSSFAKLMRGILENSREDYITLSKEVAWTHTYVELQKLRFDDSFNYRIDVDAALDMENTLIPPMLTQPFIENALEHGLSKKENGGLLNIRFRKKENYLEITVTDNGSGFDISAEEKSKGEHTSMATRITKERLKLLNRRSRNKIRFNIESLPGKGTSVTIHIPLKYR